MSELTDDVATNKLSLLERAKIHGPQVIDPLTSVQKSNVLLRCRFFKEDDLGRSFAEHMGGDWVKMWDRIEVQPREVAGIIWTQNTGAISEKKQWETILAKRELEMGRATPESAISEYSRKLDDTLKKETLRMAVILETKIAVMLREGVDPGFSTEDLRRKLKKMKYKITRFSHGALRTMEALYRSAEAMEKSLSDGVEEKTRKDKYAARLMGARPDQLPPELTQAKTVQLMAFRAVRNTKKKTPKTCTSTK